MVARRQPGLPDAVVGLVPAALDRLHHRLDDAPVLVLRPSRAQSTTAATRSATGPNTSSWIWRLAALPTRTGREPA